MLEGWGSFSLQGMKIVFSYIMSNVILAQGSCWIEPQAMLLGLGVLLWRSGSGSGCHLEAAKWEIGDKIKNYNHVKNIDDWAGFSKPFNAVAFGGLVEAFVRWDCCDDVLLDLVAAQANSTASPFAQHLLALLNHSYRLRLLPS